MPTNNREVWPKRSKAQGVFGSRLAVAITAVIVTTVVIAGGVAAASVPNNSVTTAKIRNNAVTTAKIKNGAVTTPKIKNGAVTMAKLAPGARVRAVTANGANQNIDGTGANQVVETATITAPVAGQLLITASMRPDVDATDVYGCSSFLNGSVMPASARQVEMEFAAPENGCHTNDGAAVGAGTHTVDFEVQGVSPGNEIDHTSLQVLFVPNP